MTELLPLLLEGTIDTVITVKTKPIKILWAIYVLLILYASLMPFDMDWNPADAENNFQRAWNFWPFASQYRISRSDLVSNLVLYVPLGLLAGACCGAVRRKANRLGSLSIAILAAMSVSMIIECLQLFSPSRTASAQDLLMNTVGGLAGGIIAITAGRRAWVNLRREFRLRWIYQPISLIGWLMLVLLAVDAVFPFRPTLLLSELFTSLKQSFRMVMGHDFGFSVHPWHHWLIHRVGVYAVLSMLLAASTGRGAKPKWFRGAVWAIAFAATAELAKVFIVSRFANPANVLMSACGAVVGMIIGAVMSAEKVSRRARILQAAALLAGFIIYIELTPFTFVWNPQEIAAKIPSGPQWLPLYHYAMGAWANDVLLFVRTIVLLAGLTYTLRLSDGWLDRGGRPARIVKAVAFAAVMGLILELGQFLLPTRTPSVTDIFCFALGGAIGGALARRQTTNHIAAEVTEVTEEKLK